MSLEKEAFLVALFSPTGVLWISKLSVVLLAGLYFIFSLIIVRQVKMMTETLITEVSPLLRAFSIVHAGLALGVIILLIGYLF